MKSLRKTKTTNFAHIQFSPVWLDPSTHNKTINTAVTAMPNTQKRKVTRRRTETPEKKIKTEDNEPTPGNAPKPAASKMKLDEINDDCFEEIFKYLDFIDLLNLAATNQRINQVASINFSRKYSTEAVCISPTGIYITSPDVADQPDIWLPADETAKFVRHLGHVVGRLTINSLDEDDEDDLEVASLIFQHCGDSITEIVMRGLPDTITRLIQKPFGNVENIYLNRCILGSHFLQLNKWFPNMERLMIYNCGIANAECLEETFRKLSHLTWEYGTSQNALLNDAFRALTRSNPQIESLRLDCSWDIPFLRHLDRYLKRLRKLELTLGYQDKEIRRKVYFHNVGRLVLHLRDQKALSGQIPFTFKRLDEIHLHLDCHDSLSKSMVDFVIQHKFLAKLNIFFPVDKHGLHRMANNLPCLEMLGLSGIGFSSSDAAQALNHFPRLRKFRIFNEHRFDDLLQVLGTQWHACRDRKFFLKQASTHHHTVTKN